MKKQPWQLWWEDFCTQLQINDRKYTPRERPRLEQEEALLDLSLPLEPGEEHPPKGPELYYPQAKLKGNKMITQGEYTSGYPKGAVVHFNAGRFDVVNGLAQARKDKYAYFLIDRNGGVWQDFPLDRWGYHCGKSSWGDVASDTLNDHFVGIEVMSAGPLDLMNKSGSTEQRIFRSWFKELYAEAEVRIIPKKIANQEAGNYHKYTAAQEKSLLELLTWLHQNGQGIFKYENVVGHDEISPGRKVDPGGALSMTMPQLRSKLMMIAKEKVS